MKFLQKIVVSIAYKIMNHRVQQERVSQQIPNIVRGTVVAFEVLLVRSGGKVVLMGTKWSNRTAREKQLTLAFRLLQAALALLIAGAGADKIFQVSLSWNDYLPPIIPWLLGTEPGAFLSGLGLFELVLALGIVFSPAYFGALTSLWLLLVNLVLISGGNFQDLILIDLALAISAFALSSLGQIDSLAPHLTFRLKRFHLLSQSYPRFRVVR